MVRRRRFGLEDPPATTDLIAAVRDLSEPLRTLGYLRAARIFIMRSAELNQSPLPVPLLGEERENGGGG